MGGSAPAHGKQRMNSLLCFAWVAAFASSVKLCLSSLWVVSLFYSNSPSGPTVGGGSDWSSCGALLLAGVKSHQWNSFFLERGDHLLTSQRKNIKANQKPKPNYQPTKSNGQLAWRCSLPSWDSTKILCLIQFHLTCSRIFCNIYTITESLRSLWVLWGGFYLASWSLWRDKKGFKWLLAGFSV